MATQQPDDPSNFTQKLKREIARLNGDEYERPNGDTIDYGDEEKYDQVREEDKEAIKLYRLELTDKAHTHQANQILHLRQISTELTGPILEQSATTLNTTLLDMERERDWKTDPPGSRRNHANSLATLLREHDQDDKADDIKIPSVTVDDYEVDPDTVPDWQDDILPMIENEPKLRNKALIATAWETASRVTALAGYKIKHYEPRGKEAALLKTPDAIGTKDAENNVKPLIIAHSYIDHWLSNSHPTYKNDNYTDKEIRESALFCNIQSNSEGDNIHPRTIRDRIIRPAAERVDLDPDVRANPHAMKHSRGTYLRKHPDFDKNDIEHIMDWVNGTEQHKRYIHTTNTENAITILQKSGIELDEQDKMEPLHTECPRCEKTIATDARYCYHCGQRLDDPPADWYQIYRKITDDDNPLRQEYDDIAGATPSIHKLNKDYFEYVTDIFAKAVTLFDTQWTDPDDYTGTHPSNRDWADKIDISDLDADDIDTISERWVTNSEPLEKNYLEHPTNYELSGSDSGLSATELREEADQRGLTDDEEGDPEDTEDT